MIDYYLNKKCPLVKPAGRQHENIRCGGCIWLDKELRKCIFSEHFSRSIKIDEFIFRLNKVNKQQQNKLSNPNQRFLL